jgi:hypothetical protein
MKARDNNDTNYVEFYNKMTEEYSWIKG